MTIKIYIDADACPVKDETYKVAARHGLHTIVVSNAFMQIPVSPFIARVIVGAGADVADDWIADRAEAGDVVITNDIPLAARVLAKGAHAIAPHGRAFTGDSIGLAPPALAHGASSLDGGKHGRPPAVFARQSVAIPGKPSSKPLRASKGGGLEAIRDNARRDLMPRLLL